MRRANLGAEAWHGLEKQMLPIRRAETAVRRSVSRLATSLAISVRSNTIKILFDTTG
jgi:hypothetical protein